LPATVNAAEVILFTLAALEKELAQQGHPDT